MFIKNILINEKGVYMKIKETLKEIFILILVLLNIISIAYIPSNLLTALQSPKAIKVNSLNRGIISQKILEEYDVENYKLKGSIERVEYRQLLGEWLLYIYYTDSTEETIGFRDSEGRSIRDYIDENGYDKGKFAFIILVASVILILFSIGYAINEHRKEKLPEKLDMKTQENYLEKVTNRIDFKKFLARAKTSILFYVILFIVIFVLLHFLLMLFNIQFRQWVYYVVVAIAVIGILIGLFKLESIENKIVKRIVTISTVLCFIAIPYILLYCIFLYIPEHILEKDNNKYVAKVRSFKRVDVYYYDYINFFLVGNKVRIHENYGSGGYDPFDGKHDNYEPLTYYYYDEDGKVIKTNSSNYYKTSNSNNTNQSNKTEISQDSDILYEKVINNNTIIRVINKESILAQRSIISIEKTTDGGQTWEKRLPEGMQIHNGAKFIFLDENIGFINDPGLVGTEGENSGLLVTTDGGKTFINANIIHPKNIEEKNLFVSELPYLENETLKVKIYTINHAKNPAKTFYEFSSKDNGLTWIYLKTEE